MSGKITTPLVRYKLHGNPGNGAAGNLDAVVLAAVVADAVDRKVEADLIGGGVTKAADL